MKFTFLLSSSVHVRFIKRIEILSRSGVDIDAFAFDRKNSFPGKKQEFKLESLGTITHKSYLKRSMHILKSMDRIRNAAKNTDVIYTFGLDMLLFGWISKLLSLNKKAKLVYEVGDIREVLIGNAKINKVIRLLERFLLRYVEVLVVTSEAFYYEYFLKIQKVKNLKYQVIENKLDYDLISSLEAKEKLRTESKVFTIGYFGVLRCDRTWEILKLLAQRGKGKIKIYIRGIPGLKQNEHIEDIKDIYEIDYAGPYIAPNDLHEMYGKVDMVWACYPYQGTEVGNWCWARTIRFYESCFYKKPVFVQNGTEDCKIVKKHEIGVCLDLENFKDTVDYILNFSDEKLLEWKKNIDEMPVHSYLYSNEHEELINILENSK